MNSTKIEWCEFTINPVVGCSKCSPGCDNCYAERFAARLAKNPKTAAKYAGVVDEAGKWTGKIGFAADGCFADLYNSRRAKRVFVGSMGDLFHENVPLSELLILGSAMSLMPHHTFMLLTKRPERAREMLDGALGVKGFEHIWLGVTVCNQAEADAKIPLLLSIPAAKRFVSVEPMLGPVDLTHLREYNLERKPWINALSGWITKGHLATSPAQCSIDVVSTKYERLDWVICGGETGSGARPMHPDWVRSLRDQCQEAKVPFFFKGWGEWAAPEQAAYPNANGNFQSKRFDGFQEVLLYGKKRAGRLLDGREWNEVPS